MGGDDWRMGGGGRSNGFQGTGGRISRRQHSVKGQDYSKFNACGMRSLNYHRA